MKNDGKDAEKAFTDHWDRVGHCERMRDKRDLMGINKGLTKIADFKKPSDFLVSAPDIPLHYAEVKSTQSATSFGFGGIQDGQSKAALLEASRGSKAYRFYIFSYATGQWYVMSCTQYAATLSEGRRSIRFEELLPWNK